jgi:hypothetical protein
MTNKILAWELLVEKGKKKEYRDSQQRASLLLLLRQGHQEMTLERQVQHRQRREFPNEMRVRYECG